MPLGRARREAPAGRESRRDVRRRAAASPSATAAEPTPRMGNIVLTDMAPRCCKRHASAEPGFLRRVRPGFSWTIMSRWLARAGRRTPTASRSPAWRGLLEEPCYRSRQLPGADGFDQMQLETGLLALLGVRLTRVTGERDGA